MSWRHTLIWQNALMNAVIFLLWKNIQALCSGHVILLDDIFRLLREYYHVIYNSQQPISRTIMQFGRLCIGSEVYGHRYPPTMQNDHTFEQNFQRTGIIQSIYTRNRYNSFFNIPLNRKHIIQPIFDGIGQIKDDLVFL